MTSLKKQNPVFEKILTLAKTQEAKARKIQLLKASTSKKTFLKYIFYRLRYPILGRIVTRFIRLLEVFLVFYYFQGNFFNTVTLVLYFLIIYEGLSQGGLQYFRFLMVKFQLRENQEYANQTLGITLIYSIILSIIAIFGLSIYCILNELETNTYLILAAIGIVLPLQNISQALWVLAYTQKRLKITFYLLVLIQLIPSVMLVLFHKTFGEMVFIFSFFASKFLYSVYLTKIAWTDLKFEQYCLVFPKSIKFIREIVCNKKFLSFASFPFFHNAYYLILALLIFFNSQFYWKTYLFFFFIVYFFSSFSIQISRSLALDLHLALKYAKLKDAKRLLKQINFFYFLAIILSISLFLLLFIYIPQIFSFGQNTILNYFACFLIALFAKSFFETQYKLFEAAKDEASLIKIFFIIFTLGTIIQYQLIYNFDANLQGILAFDALIFLVLSGYMFLTINLKKSYLVNLYWNERSKYDLLVRSSEVFLIFKQNKNYKENLHCLFIINPENNTTKHNQKIINSIVRERHKNEILITQIAEGLFFCSFLNYQDYLEIRKKYSGHIKNFIELKNRSISELIDHIILSLKYSSYKDFNIKDFLESLKLIQENNLLNKFSNDIKIQDLYNLIKTETNKDINFAYLKENKIIYLNKTTDFGLKAEKVLLNEWNKVKWWDATIDKKYNIICFLKYGIAYAVMDLNGLSSYQKKLIRTFAIVFEIDNIRGMLSK